MGIFVKNGKYWIDYRLNGKRKRECIGPDRKLAEVALETRKLDIFLQNSFAVKRVANSPYFEDFAEEYLEHVKEKKRSWRRDLIIIKSAMTHFMGVRMDDITPTKVAEYKVKRADEVKPGTVNRELACLRHIFSLAVKWGKAGFNPLKEVRVLEMPKRPERILSDDEAERLVSSAKGQTRDIIIMALNTGMKLGEILFLKWEDVDFTECVVTVKGSRRERDRKIPMNSTVLAHLKGAKGPGGSPYIFADPQTGQPIKKIEKGFKTALTKAGLEGCTFHDLRHSFGMRLVQNGVDPLTVKELLGHSTLEVTKRYFQSTPEKKRKAVELISNFRRWRPSPAESTSVGSKTTGTPPQVEDSSQAINN